MKKIPLPSPTPRLLLSPALRSEVDRLKADPTFQAQALAAFELILETSESARVLFLGRPRLETTTSFEEDCEEVAAWISGYLVEGVEKATKELHRAFKEAEGRPDLSLIRFSKILRSDQLRRLVPRLRRLFRERPTRYVYWIDSTPE